MIYRRENLRQGFAQIMVVIVVVVVIMVVTMVVIMICNDFIVSCFVAPRMREPQTASARAMQAFGSPDPALVRRCQLSPGRGVHCILSLTLPNGRMPHSR
jgi:hypothetical protein